MKRQSIATNGTYTVIAKVYAMIVPILTMPYILRVLGVVSYGKVSYVQSLIAYFNLFAMMGISSYALRECSIVRDNHEKLKEKASQIFTISLFTTGISFALFLLYTVLVADARYDYKLYLVFSLMIISNTMMMTWLYSSLERFDLVAVRDIIGRTIYLLGCFLLIRNSNDYILFAIVIVSSLSIIPAIINNIGIWKGVCGIIPRIYIGKELKSCVTSVFYLGLLDVGSKLFSASDVIMTKWLVSDNADKAVGLYNSGILLPLVIEQLVFVIVGVATPRFYKYMGQGDNQNTSQLTNLVSNAMYLVVVPAVLTCLFFPKQLLFLLGGNEYLPAAHVLQIYSLLLITATAVTIAGTRTYVARKKEKKLFKILITMAMLNIILDVFLIRQWGINGAATATILSNVILMIVELSLEHSWNLVFTKDKFVYLGGAALISLLFLVVKNIWKDLPIAYFFGCIIVVGVVYMSYLYLVKESTIMLVLKKLRNNH